VPPLCSEVLAAAALGPGLLAQPAAPAGGTVLPTRLADLSLLTAPVSGAPAGAAILAYVQGGRRPALAAHHADRRRRRRTGTRTGGSTRPKRRGGPAEPGTWQDAPALLAPDGTRVAVGSVGPAADLAVVTCAPAGPGPTARCRPASSGPSPGRGREPARVHHRRHGHAVLDLATGASITIGPPALAAAFAPDGRRVAVQGRPETEVEPQRTIPGRRPGRRRDGRAGLGRVRGADRRPQRLVAGRRWLALADNAGAGKLECRLTFLPADPADRTAPPAPVATAQEIALVGWVAPGRPLITQGGATGHRTIVEAPGFRRLSTVDGFEQHV
jgi:hypothetical protein